MNRRSKRINKQSETQLRPTYNTEIFSEEGSSDEISSKCEEKSLSRKSKSSSRTHADVSNVQRKGADVSKRHSGKEKVQDSSEEDTANSQKKKHHKKTELRRSNRIRNDAMFFDRGQTDSVETEQPSRSRVNSKRSSSEKHSDESMNFESESNGGIFSDEGENKSKSNSTKHKSKTVTSKSKHSRHQKVRHLSSSLSEEEEEEDEESESDNGSDWTSSSVDSKQQKSIRRSNKPRTSSRQMTQLKISYKEASDDGTDSDDLIEMSEPDDEDAGSAEIVEKVMKSRKGRKGATGMITTIYNVEKDGDPNSGLDLNEDALELQYLIKWKNRSHLHNTWESEETLRQMKVNGMKKLENFKKRELEQSHWREMASPEEIEYHECQNEFTEQLYSQYCGAERIVTHYSSKDTDDSENCEYFVKWQGLPYSECTREDSHLIKKRFPIIVEQYEQRLKSTTVPNRHCKALKHRPKFHTLKSQPDYIGGKKKLQLRDYQLKGLNWLLHSWCKENGAILADEMGLGKTIQTISFLSALMHEHHVYGPFLLIVPLSTVVNWQREFESWAPQINATVYIGDINTRLMIQDYEWYQEGSKRLKCNVVITTYEILLKDKSYLAEINWAVLGVDEAHRLKNDDSMLYKSLIDFRTNHRLFITGTPLQNSLRELWSLLHFINPKKFDNWEEFEEKHGSSDKTGFHHLHQELQPYLLRRVKKDVEKSLPAKVEQILRVEMSRSQKQYYRWILTRNYKALAKGLKGNISGFVNVMIELKKCCNHVALVRPLENEMNTSDICEALVKGSGKLLLLEKLLPQLRESGHRVLIFSQMVRMLDIIAEYLKLKGFFFQRLDGTINSERRKQAMDHFNAEGSQDFCFLLSTRAGGLGVNLVTADTVIIFDSDWNPQNDLQAMARAHRIGQKNQVSVYRLITKNSVEEEIIERAKKKMVLDHLVIQRMDTSGRTVLDRTGLGGQNSRNPFNKEELNSILRFGAEELFKESDDEDGDSQVDIDDILRLAETRNTEELQRNATDELFSNFKIVSFDKLEEDEDDDDEHRKHEPVKGWEEIIPEAERQKIEEEERQLQLSETNLPPRNRRQLKESQPSDSDQEDTRRRTRQKRGKDEEEDEEEDEDEEETGESEDEDEKQLKRRGKAKESVKGFTDAELRRFVKSLKKFGRPKERIEDVAEDAELQEKSEADLQNLTSLILSNCDQTIKEFEEKSKDEKSEEGEGKKPQKRPTFRLGTVTVNARSVLQALQELEPLAAMMSNDKEKVQLENCVKRARFDCYWTPEDDVNLLKGVYAYGMGNWEAIKVDSDLKLIDKILPDLGLKPQVKQLRTRTEYLLKILSEQMSGLAEEKAKPGKHVVKEKRKRKTTEESTGSEDSTKKDTHDKIRSKEKKESRTEKKNKKEDGKEKTRAPVHITTKNTVEVNENGVAELPPEVFEECKEKMKPVRKSLKRLKNLDSSRTKNHVQLMEVILSIGNQISEVLTDYNDPDKIKECRGNLWQFVSKFSKYDAARLHKLFKNAARKHQEEEERKMMEQERQPDTAPHYGSRYDHDRWPHRPSKRPAAASADNRPEPTSKHLKTSHWTKIETDVAMDTANDSSSASSSQPHSTSHQSNYGYRRDVIHSSTDVQHPSLSANPSRYSYKRGEVSQQALPPPPHISTNLRYVSPLDAQHYSQTWRGDKPVNSYNCPPSHHYGYSSQGRRSYPPNQNADGSQSKQNYRRQSDSQYSGYPQQLRTHSSWPSHVYRPYDQGAHSDQYRPSHRDDRHYNQTRFSRDLQEVSHDLETGIPKEPSTADLPGTPMQPSCIPTSSQFSFTTGVSSPSAAMLSASSCTPATGQQSNQFHHNT